MSTERTIDIVFDGPPSHQSGRFIEVEENGRSICFGEWIKRPDGLWAIRFAVGGCSCLHPVASHGVAGCCVDRCRCANSTRVAELLAGIKSSQEGVADAGRN